VILVEIVKISNGFLVVHGAGPFDWIYCTDLSDVQQHLEMILLNEDIQQSDSEMEMDL